MIFKNYIPKLLLLKIFFWSLLFLGYKSFAQNNTLLFNHLDVTNGLSNNTVMSIGQDSTGYMWFGTKDGLNRYDGRTFKICKNDFQEKNNLPFDNYIRKLIITKNKKIWLQSSELNLYNPENNSFEVIIPQKENLTEIIQDSNGNLWIGTKKQLKFKAANSKEIIPLKIEKRNITVTDLFEDHEHHIWVATTTGLYELFFANKKLVKKKYFNSLFEKDEMGQIFCMMQDRNLKYWIGTRKTGLYLFDKKSSHLTHFKKNNNDKNSLVSNNLRKILLHKNGSLWIGTQDGLSILNPNNLQFVNYQHDPTNPNSLNQNSIYDIFQDKDGSVWIGTFFGGINVVYSVNTPFTVYQNSSNKYSISSNIISSIVEDSKHNLWIGTEAGGLNYLNRNSQQFSNYKNNSNNSLSSNLVKAIAIDKDQNIWIGTAGDLNLFDPKTSKFTNFSQNGPSSINCLVIDKKNNLFIGSNAGLNIFNIAKNKKFHKGKTYIEKSINALFEDRKGNIWIGTPIGIYHYQNSKIQYKNFKDNLNTPFNYNVNCFYQDSKGNMWVGTNHNGLALLNQKNNSFNFFNTKDGLPSDNISAITEDKDANLWISTTNGLVKYEPRLKTFRSFNTLDGLPDNQFNINSVLKDHQGRLFFGTYKGLVSFIPQSIGKNNIPPDIVFSNLKLFNVPVKINDESGILKQDINFSNTLTFNHDQNHFTIEFSALNFIKSNKNRYAYMLDGLEKKWNYVDVPSATYINLPAGHYQFLVKSANNDNVWNKNVKKIDIVIIPPIWKTWWAYLIYFAIAFTIAYYILKFLKARADLKQELHFENLRAEHLKQDYQMKLDFFTNISHEIRTPLTLILGPIEKLEQLTAENKQAHKYTLSIKNNTERLYRLVNELLDFRKVDSGNMRLYFFEEDIVHALKKIFNHFQTLAEAKNIQYTFESSDSQILVYFDKEQLEKVFFNLLSNAFKFTQNGGSISLVITLKEKQVEIKVTDNGKGIAIDTIDNIFKNFYQAGQNMGTGIGLALTKSLTELHKGKITVTSKPATATETGKTTFTVLLQLGKNHLNEIDIAPIPDVENIIYEDVDDVSTEGLIDTPIIADKRKSATILIVEDNEDIREFIKQSLESQYHVYESENGLEGWEKAIQTLPDLIISDVMMPVMDGLELCEKVKTDVRTSHIPVILLTAKSAPIHQIHGLQHGADAYITKPFSNQILQLNIRNLLTLKLALQKKYSEQLLELPIITSSKLSQEEIFLQKLKQIIEDNIGNSNLDLSFITTEIGMSKSVLYKKFSALTNQSLNVFIKTHRLKRAAEIFQKGETSIESVALQVGFVNVNYFSSEFKKTYGITPNNYIKNKG